MEGRIDSLSNKKNLVVKGSLQEVSGKAWHKFRSNPSVKGGMVYKGRRVDVSPRNSML